MEVSVKRELTVIRDLSEIGRGKGAVENRVGSQLF